LRQFAACAETGGGKMSTSMSTYFGVKMMHKTITAALVCMFFSTAALAEVTVKDAWIRGTTPAQSVTGAFMEITSTEDAALLSAATPVAGTVEMHTMSMEAGVMKMRPVQKIDLPAGKPVVLAPGAYHIMLMGLKQPLNKGDVVPITLKIEGKNAQVQTLEVKAEVRDLAAPAMMHGGMKH
jgi:copper(I)-binding protein